MEFTFWQILILLITASITATVLGITLGGLVARKLKLCDFKMMNGLFITTWIEYLIGACLYGGIFALGHSANPILAFFGGAIGYSISFYFFGFKKYDKLRKSFELLNINNDEDLEKFMKEQEGA